MTLSVSNLPINLSNYFITTFMINFASYLLVLVILIGGAAAYSESINLSYEVFSQGKSIGSFKQEVIFTKNDRQYLQAWSIFVKGWWGKYELKELNFEQYDEALGLQSAISKSYENQQANWIELIREDNGELRHSHQSTKKMNRRERERLAFLSERVGKIGLGNIERFRTEFDEIYARYGKPRAIADFYNSGSIVTSTRLPEKLLSKFKRQASTEGGNMGEVTIYDNEIMKLQSHKVEFTGLVREMLHGKVVTAHSFSLKRPNHPAGSIWVARHPNGNFPYMLRYTGVDADGEFEILLAGLNNIQ